MIRRRFTLADQHWFAQASGDFNPLHCDPAWAAAAFPGEVVVHGIHALLWGLEHWLGRRPGVVLASIHTTFVRPIVLGDEVVAATGGDGTVLRLLVGDEPMLVARLRPGLAPAADPLPQPGDTAPRPPRDLDFDRLGGLSGAVPPSDADQLAQAFPAVAAACGPALLAGLASLSTLVGMECPGLHAMFSEFSVSRDPAGGALTYGVKRRDPVFSRVDLVVKGAGLSGSVSAFVGRADIPPSDAAIRALVAPDEFAGARPLVVGASGGLGAVTARLLAAGGATPVVTWHRSAAGAEATARSIAALGGRCQSLRLDVAAPAPALAELVAGGWQGGVVYYFATPRIFRRRLEPFQAADLRAFLDVYVDGFYALMRGLAAELPGIPMKVFYPSTVAIDEPVADLLEYAMAKASGERLCAALMERMRGLAVTIHRLPRIATRQTQSFVRVAAETPERAMTPILRALQGVQ